MWTLKGLQTAIQLGQIKLLTSGCIILKDGRHKKLDKGFELC